MAKIPKEWRQYFWEVEPKDIELEKHAWYIMGRVLEWGNLDAVRKLRRYYGDARLKEFLLSTNSRVLSNYSKDFDFFTAKQFKVANLLKGLQRRGKCQDIRKAWETLFLKFDSIYFEKEVGKIVL